MTKLSNRLASLEAHAGQGHDAISRIDRPIVQPAPDGARYTGDVLVKAIGGTSIGGDWERRGELVGMPASDAKGGLRK